MLGKGFFALLLVLCFVVIIFLLFQIQDTSNRTRDVKIKDQENITKAARLLVQSSTQYHPLFAHDHAIEAKFIIDQVIYSNGGISMAEKFLKLPKGKLDLLRTQINDQYQDTQSYIVEEIIKKNPSLETELNEAAGLKRPKRSKRRSSEKNYKPSDKQIRRSTQK